MYVVEQGVDPFSRQLFVPVFQLWRWNLDVTFGGIIAVALIRTVSHKTVIRVVIEGGSDSDVFPSLGVSLLAMMIELVRR